MKVNTITRTVEIDNATIFNLFISAVYGDAKASTDKDRTFYRALGHLIGISDAAAVEIANSQVKKEDRITVTAFQKWLPTVFAEFARAMTEASDEAR